MIYDAEAEYRSHVSSKPNTANIDVRLARSFAVSPRVLVFAQVVLARIAGVLQTKRSASALLDAEAVAEAHRDVKRSRALRSKLKLKRRTGAVFDIHGPSTARTSGFGLGEGVGVGAQHRVRTGSGSGRGDRFKVAPNGSRTSSSTPSVHKGREGSVSGDSDSFGFDGEQSIASSGGIGGGRDGPSRRSKQPTLQTSMRDGTTNASLLPITSTDKVTAGIKSVLPSQQDFIPVPSSSIFVILISVSKTSITATAQPLVQNVGVSILLLEPIDLCISINNNSANNTNTTEQKTQRLISNVADSSKSTPPSLVGERDKDNTPLLSSASPTLLPMTSTVPPLSSLVCVTFFLPDIELVVWQLPTGSSVSAVSKASTC